MMHIKKVEGKIKSTSIDFEVDVHYTALNIPVSMMVSSSPDLFWGVGFFYLLVK